MPFTIKRLDEAPRRDGTVVNYLFAVSNGESSHSVALSIPEQAYLRIGEPQKPKEVWWNLAEEWLQRHLDDGSFNPFRQPPGVPLPPVPLVFADHWLANH